MQQTIKTLSGRTLILPTPEEEAAINAGITADPDTYELTDEEFVNLKPAGGLPNSASTTVFTAIRLDAEVLAAFKSSGQGWQARINTVLKEWLSNHSPGETVNK